MERERLLVGAVVAVVVLALGVILLAPNALAEREETREPSSLRLEEISITDGRVGGETLDLTADVRLEHDGSVSENVTVEFRAIGLDSGLVAATRTLEVGSITETRETSVLTNLTVDRGGDYRIEAVVYENGNRVTVGHKEVRGTDALTPAYADTPVEFHRFTRQDLPTIEYSIGAVDGNRSTLSVSTYLTNTGDETAGDLRLVLKARQVDSGIVADEREVGIDDIGPGRTATPETELTVPSQYNYYLDAVLWKDGVVVGTARAGASLDPTERVPTNTTERDVGLQVGDFESDDRSEQESTPRPENSDGDGPGFGVGVALVALLVGSLLLARNGNTEEP